MREKTYSTEGVVLSRRNFGEADRLLTIFSKHYGKLKIIAKGVRKPFSRKRGALEIFTYARFMLARGRNMDIVTDVEIKNSFPDWRDNLLKVGVAYHLCEVTERLTVEQQEHKKTFALLIESLTALDKLDEWQLHTLAQTFKITALEELGFIERGKPTPKNVDAFIEELINSKLKTRKLLTAITKAPYNPRN